MHIEPKEYLSLLDEIDSLKKENLFLKQENVTLSEMLVKEQQKQLQQEQNAIRAMKVVEELHAKAIAYEIQQKNQIIQRMVQIDKQTKEYLESKFSHLEHSSLTQVKSLELQSAKTKLNFYELVDFVNKVRALYNSTLGLDLAKVKKQASLMDLMKWMKSLPGVAINFTKTGFFTAPSTTGMKKKTLTQSRLKQNRAPSAGSRQKSRIKI